MQLFDFHFFVWFVLARSSTARDQPCGCSSHSSIHCHRNVYNTRDIQNVETLLAMNSTERTSSQLSEQYVQDSFHSYLKSSLTQAKAERLLDVDVLASAEADLMITGALFPRSCHQNLFIELELSRTRAMSVFCSFAMHDKPTLSSTSDIFEINVFSTDGAFIRKLSTAFRFLSPCMGKRRSLHPSLDPRDTT